MSEAVQTTIRAVLDKWSAERIPHADILRILTEVREGVLADAAIQQQSLQASGLHGRALVWLQRCAQSVARSAQQLDRRLGARQTVLLGSIAKPTPRSGASQ